MEQSHPLTLSTLLLICFGYFYVALASAMVGLAFISPSTLVNLLAAHGFSFSASAVAAALVAFGLFFFAFGFLEVLTAIGLWNHKEWARVMASLYAVSDILMWSLGAVAGAVILYSVWLHPESAELFGD